MDEFLRLYLTGKRAEELERFDRIRSILGIIGGVLTLIPVFLHLFGAGNLPLNISLSVLGLLFELTASFLSLHKKKYAGELVELEYSASLLGKSGREREIHQKLYEAWKETLGKPDVRFLISNIIAAIGYTTLVLAVILVTFLHLREIVLLAAGILSTGILMIPIAMRVSIEGTARAKLYETAGQEIDTIKRTKFGKSEKKIFEESENARGFSSLPVSVAMFLKEDVEREEFRALSKRSGILSFLIGFLFGIFVMLSPVWLSIIMDRLGSTLTWTLGEVLLVVVFGTMIAFLIPIEAKKRAIYRRNAEKLGSGEPDSIRMHLQSAWVRLQKIGNTMFLCFFVGSIVCGATMGLIGYFMVDGLNLAESVGSCIMYFLLPAALISIVIWFIVFAVYRKKVRPLELQLKTLERGEEEV